jgi:hypothetical protein
MAMKYKRFFYDQPSRIVRRGGALIFHRFSLLLLDLQTKTVSEAYAAARPCLLHGSEIQLAVIGLV